MKRKLTQRVWMIWLILMLALPPLTWADMVDPGGNVTLSGGDFSPVGGFSSLGGMGLASGSRLPARLSRQDYQELYDQADDWLGAARDYRRLELQYTPSYSVTTIAQLEQNYMDLNGGEEYARFCADYNAVDAQGYCPEGDPALPDPQDIRNKLIWARDAFAVLSVADPADVQIEIEENVYKPAREVGREGVLQVTREIANVHLLLGGEFLIDALDTRFSGADSVVGAATLVEEEIRQLDLARLHFALAMDALVEAFTMDIGGAYGTHMADYFGSEEYELYGMASERLAFALGELAFRYRQLGTGTVTFVDGRTEQIQGDQSALALYTTAFSNQYVQALGLAQKAAERDIDFYAHGGWQILESVARVHEGARAIQEGLNPFGYRDDYVPRETFANLMQTARDRQAEAADLEQDALNFDRQFDIDARTVMQAAQDLKDEYVTELVNLCGGSGTQPTDFAVCDGGLIEQNYYDMVAASRRIALAWQRANDIVERIQIEQARASETIRVILEGGEQIAAIELAEGVLRAIQTTSTQVDATTTTSAWGFGQEVKGYVEAWVGGGVTANIGAPPSASVEVGGLKAGIELAATCVGDYRHERSTTHAIETTTNLNELGIGQYESMRALANAEGDATIVGIESDAVIKNLLLDQAERSIEWEIAVQEYNKLSAEHNHLVERYYNTINLWQEAERVTVDSYLNNPGYRFLRELAALNAAREQARAARYAYLAAKAAEYDFLPSAPNTVPFIGDIYKARTASEVLTFLNDLQDWYNQQKTSPEPYVQKLYTISLARDVAGLTDEALDPTGALTPTQLAELRFERFQEFLQDHVVTATVRVAGEEIDRRFLSVSFETSLRNQLDYGGFYSSDDWNIRIVGLNQPEEICAPPQDPCEGVAIDIATRQVWTSPTDPSVMLRHGGVNSLQDGGGNLREYAPGPLVLFSEYADPPGEVWFKEQGAVASVSASVNGEGGGHTPQLFNLSVAASAWRLRIDLEANRLLDVTQIEDVVITLDTSAHARQTTSTDGPGPAQVRPEPATPQLEASPLEPLASFYPSGLAPGVGEGVTGEICCSILIPPPAACEGRGIWGHVSTVLPLARAGDLEPESLALVSPTIDSPAQATVVISGTFEGTVAITEPVRLGAVDIAFDLVDLGGLLSGTLDVSDTLAFASDGPPPGLTGIVSGNLFVLTSQPFNTLVSGRQVQRRFTIVGQALEDGARLEGIYTEEITGFTPEPITVIAMFAASGPVRHQDLLAHTPSTLRVEAESGSVGINGSTTISATLFNGLARPLTDTHLISFTTDLGTVTPPAADTVGGVAVTTFTGGDTPGWATITATDGIFIDWVQVRVGQGNAIYLPIVVRND